jgi:hypothetical protein
MRNLLALIGALLATISTLPYIIDIIKRRTKPNIVSWITWTMLTGIAMAAAFAAREPRTAILMLGSTVCTFAVVVLGLRYGIAKFSPFDGLCQLGAVVGLVLWLIFNSPSIAIIAAVTIDFIGMLPTLRHSWLEPQEETWQTFVIGIVAPLFTIVSLEAFNVASLLYPIYLVLANSAIVFAVIYRRKLLGISLARQGVRETLHQ